MAYSKLPMLVTDSPLGYQTVNQASDNIDNTRSIYAVRHGINDGSGGFWGRYGKHNDPSIPKSVLTLLYSTANTFADYFQISTGPAIKEWIRISAGYIEVHVTGLATPRAIVTQYMYGTATPRIHKVVRQSPNTINGIAVSDYFTFHVYLYERDSGSGAFELGDMGFTFTVYGTPG